MSTVNIVSSPGTRIPDPSQVAIAVGGTITFSADSDSVIYFSVAAAAILSPSPQDLQAVLAAGATVTFTFTSAPDGTLCCQVCPPNVAYPDSMSCQPIGGSYLAILAGSDPGFDFGDTGSGT